MGELRFPIGKCVATPGALEAMEDAGQTPSDFLDRHVVCDWGDVCEEDKEANDYDLHHGGRLLSVYYTSKGVKLWVITEADRSATTILLPGEY